MDRQDETVSNNNCSFAEMTCNPVRQLADESLTHTIEGLLDRGVSQYHIARSLFDMALSISAKCDVKDWWYLLEYFCDTTDIHRNNLNSIIHESGE